MSAAPEALPRAGATTINWARRDQLLQVDPGGTLVLDGIIVQNLAPYIPRPLRTPGVSGIAETAGVALQPTVLFSAGSTVSTGLHMPGMLRACIEGESVPRLYISLSFRVKCQSARPILLLKALDTLRAMIGLRLVCTCCCAPRIVHRPAPAVDMLLQGRPAAVCGTLT